MSRPNLGPRLVMREPRGYARKLYFVVWYENGKRVERATSTDVREHAEEFLSQVLASRREKLETDSATETTDYVTSESPAESSRGIVRPVPKMIADGDKPITEILAAYASFMTDQATLGHVRAPEREGYAMEPLLAFWSEKTLKDITKASLAKYSIYRAKPVHPGACGGPTQNNEQCEGVTVGTIRRELGVLRTAIAHAKSENIIYYTPTIQLPGKPKSNPENYYSRKEIAALLRGARRGCRLTSWLICLFILIAIYTGQRSKAILELRWSVSDDGGWIDLERGRINFLAEGADQSKKRRATSSVIPPRLLTFLRYAYAKREGEYVFELRGKRIECNKPAFRKALAAAGFERRGRFRHTLRDTCITWLLDAGMGHWHVSKYIELSLEEVERTYGKKTVGGPERINMRKKLRLDEWLDKIS